MRMNDALPRRSIGLCLMALLVAIFIVGEPLADATPRGPTQPEPTFDEMEASRLLARRRRRRRPRRAVRRRKRPTKAPAPAPAPASEEDDEKAAPAPSAPPPTSGALQRGARVEFDGRLVQGQTAKSGAIYLFARKRSRLRSMVKERVNYRKEVLRTVYPTFSKK